MPLVHRSPGFALRKSDALSKAKSRYRQRSAGRSMMALDTTRTLAALDPAALRAAYEGGKTLLQLADEYGVSLTPIYHRLRQAGTPMRGTGRAVIRESNLALRAAYEGGKTVQQLADEHGVSHQAVRARLIRAGTAMRPRGPMAR